MQHHRDPGLDPRVVDHIVGATTEHLLAYITTFHRLSRDPGHAGWDDADTIHDIANGELIRRGVLTEAA